jgi:hypothetical protein
LARSATTILGYRVAMAALPGKGRCRRRAAGNNAEQTNDEQTNNKQQRELIISSVRVVI